MRCVIAGSRSILSYDIVCEVIKVSGYEITVVISGGAPGVDTLGERYAEEHGISIEPYRAKWRTEDGFYDRGAGIKRNVEMARVADCAIIVWDGHSPGSKNMIENMKKRNKPYFVYVYTAPEVKSQEDNLWDMIYEEKNC